MFLKIGSALAALILAAPLHAATVNVSAVVDLNNGSFVAGGTYINNFSVASQSISDGDTIKLDIDFLNGDLLKLTPPGSGSRYVNVVGVTSGTSNEARSVSLDFDNASIAAPTLQSGLTFGNGVILLGGGSFSTNFTTMFTFGGFSTSADVFNGDWTLSNLRIDISSGNSPTIVDSTVVPLPAAGWMLLAGALGLLGLKRRASGPA